jgi:methionyl-tRNA formyltransferase
LRIIFMGSPDFAIPPLRHLILNRHEVIAVYTRPDKPSGRGREPAATPVKQAAVTEGLPVVQVSSLKHPEALEQMRGFRPEAIVVAAYGQILPPAVLEIPCYGCINIHPSLLPKYRGPSPVITTLLAGDEFAGVSIMRLDAGMDTGPIFSRAQIPVLDQDTAGSLTARLFEIGARMLQEELALLSQGKLLPEPQNPDLASYTHEITKEESRIDWQVAAPVIWRQVRAYQPWPEAYTSWQDKYLKIIEAVPLSAAVKPEIGRVIALGQGYCPPGVAFGVGTGDGVLGVKKVQIEAKCAMSA